MPVDSGKPEVHTHSGGVRLLPGPALASLICDLHHRGAAIRFRAAGYSMSPFIRDGDMLTVSPLPRKGAHLGDVAAFIRPATGSLVLHRVVGTTGGRLILAGDCTPNERDVVPAGELLGVVTAVERDGGRVALGMGPERRLIALLSRRRLMLPLLFAASRIAPPLLKRLAA